MDQDVSFAFFTEIGIIDQLAKAEFARVLPPGLSVAGFSVLDRFVRLGLSGESPGRLAEVFQVTRGTMTHTLGRLLAADFVRVVRDPVQWRGKIVTLTPKGAQARDAALAALQPVFIAFNQAFGAARLAEATPLLRAVREHLDAQRNPAPDALKSAAQDGGTISVSPSVKPDVRPRSSGSRTAKRP